MLKILGVRFNDQPFVFRKQGEQKAGSEVIQVRNKMAKDTVWIISEVDPLSRRFGQNRVRTVRKRKNQ